MIREIYGRTPGDPMKDFDVNLAIWGRYLGKDYDMNFRFVKNHLWKTAGQLFRETKKLVSG